MLAPCGGSFYGYLDELDVTDFYCGAGGSSTGLREAGFTIKVAANHWQRAIETHSANHPDTEHLCADVSQIDLRYLPRTLVLWASPICTELSPAGGRRKKGHQLDLFEEHGHVPTAAFERTRVTFWEVIRAAELHRYPFVVIENVVEAAEWELFDVWLAGMTALGYQHQFVSISAAHAFDLQGNDPAPQWRNRIYGIFTRTGIKQPDLSPRPLAYCPRCDEVVESVQWWKPRKGQKTFLGRTIGKYGPQYLYVCPVGDHGVIEPFTAPAAAALDLTDLGVRIGDREQFGMRPLGASTLRRVEYGLRTLGDPALVAAGGNTYDSASGAPNGYLRAWPVDDSPTPAQVTTVQNGLAATPQFVMGVNHGGSNGRPFPAAGQPLPTTTVKRGEALVTPEPFVTMLRQHAGPTRLDEPLDTFTTSRHHYLTVPPGAMIMKQYGGRLDDRHAVKPVTEPLPPAVAHSAPTLVIPYRKGAKAHGTDRPLSTVATREAHALMQAGVSVEDCYFRMVKPREAANAQRFPADYTIHGNNGEQQMQAGNAVAVNVARWIGNRIKTAL